MNYGINGRKLRDCRPVSGMLAISATLLRGVYGLQNPFRRSRPVPDRIKAIDALIPGDDLTPFQKAFKWVLANENISSIAAGMANMEEAKQDVPLGMTES